MSLLSAHRSGFPEGFSAITSLDDSSGIALGVLKTSGLRQKAAHETAWLLLEGTAEVRVGTARASLRRHSVFDDAPQAVHVSAGTEVEFSASAACEWLVCSVKNTEAFEPRIYAAVADEHRGQGRAHDAAYRLVRTVFDGNNAPLAAQLVLGEVINLPGRWSSYPPHHHPQPELYHYRFSLPQGYGHAELGEQVVKVHPFDTLRILNGVDHPQCAAPGYAMYYAWVIRHLPGQRYHTPEFSPSHRWTMDEGAHGHWPKAAHRP